MPLCMGVVLNYGFCFSSVFGQHAKLCLSVFRVPAHMRRSVIGLALQNELKEVMHGLSHLSANLPGQSRDLAATTPRSPGRHYMPYSNPPESELQRLHAEVAMLRVCVQ